MGRNRKTSNNRSRNKQRGGSNSAHGYAEQLYGTTPHAAPGTNVVAMNPPHQGGGGRRKRRGGTVLGDVAIPAMFLYANSAFRPRSGMYTRRNKKHGRSSRNKSSHRRR